ncbi:FG-GAP-like repeat-containing protein, partial [Paraglaciecola sp. MB-3u-78]|uniref:FG-GAP-like repeat-containing protein n=1 Tax=Paraglaciecola sp. MB-3u-78 TaxID=2058332 RepID=UPI000CB12C89
LVLGDIDGDGDLDVLAGNFNQSNKLYLNEGSGSFSTTGVNIGNERGSTRALTLGDIDGDGDLDVLDGNNGANKLYRQVSFMTHAGRVVSNKVNDTETDILAVRFNVTQTSNTPTTRNTRIDYYVSNNGGIQWHQVTPGQVFAFPDAGTDDLRWKAQLRSLSPSRTPLLSQVTLEQVNPNDLDGDGILDVDDAFPLFAIGALLDTDNDGAPNECDAACIALGMNADDDDDGDGVLDVNDAFPLDFIEDSLDTDNDG